jgi:hypothetical protein
VLCHGVDQIQLTVKNFQRSFQYYETVLHDLGFERGYLEPDKVAAFFGPFQFWITKSKAELNKDRYSPHRVGFRSLAFRVRKRRDVDDFYEMLVRNKFKVLAEPQEYPRMQRDYYSVFFADPDNMKLEVVYRPF